MKLRSRFFDLFGSQEFEIPMEPAAWRTSSLEQVGGTVRLSLHDGEPPMIHVDMTDEGGGRVFSSLRFNLAALDAHINDLIKHRDLLAQMAKKEGDNEQPD